MTLYGEKDRALRAVLQIAMLLQANGWANALRALLKDEQERGPDFLRLANALSALYPKNSEGNGVGLRYLGIDSPPLSG